MTNINKIQKSVATNLIWRFIERCGAQGVAFIVSLVLARLLDPNLYGTIALVTVFTTIMQVFVDSGLGNALIQKKNADDLDFSTVFFFNIVICALLYFIMFLVAPLISAFYSKPELTTIVRVLSLILIISGVKNVQQAYVSRYLLFRKFFFATLGGTIGAAIIGIYMAWKGFGVWALVAQYLTNTTVDTIVLSISLRVKPQIKYSWLRLKRLLPFGVRILATNLLIQGYQDLRAIIIGKVYSSSDLAYYDKAKSFPSIIVTNINTSISAVLFPKMSEQQDDICKVKEIAKRSIRFSSYIMCPMMLGMAAVAKPLVLILLTSKWLPCVPLLQLLCINSLCLPLHTANMQAIQAMGRSDITFRLEIVKKTIELVVLLCTMRISVTAIVVGMALCSVMFIFLNSWPNADLINYKVWEQVKDIAPGFILSLIMATGVMFVGQLYINLILSLLLQIITGVTIYVLLSIITNNSEFIYLKNHFLKKIAHNLLRR